MEFQAINVINGKVFRYLDYLVLCANRQWFRTISGLFNVQKKFIQYHCNK